MFWKKKEKINVEDYDNEIDINGEIHYVDYDTDLYIDELKRKLFRAERELMGIKSVLKTGEYEPPMSRECSDCQFVVVSPWDRKQPIGCRKNLVCESFERKKED